MSNEHETKALALEPRPTDLLPARTAWQQMTEMALAAHKSGLMPDGVRNPEAALTTALKGYELGVPFMAAIEGIHIIKGRATVGAHLMLALIKRTYGGQAIRVAKSDAKACTIEYREPGWGEVATYTFTWQDATNAGLTDSANWKKFPAAMLRARAISAVGKMAFPEVIGGLYVAGELGDQAEVTPDGDVLPVNVVDVTPTRPNEGPGRAEPAQRPPDTINLPADEPEPPSDVQEAEWSEPAPAKAMITDRQMKFLWAIAKEKFDEDADLVLHALVGLRGLESLKELNRDQASKMGDYLKAESPGTIAKLAGVALRPQPAPEQEVMEIEGAPTDTAY